MKQKMNMRIWKENVIRNPYKKGAPVLSFPSVQLLGLTVKQLISTSDSQANGMKLIADRCPSLASLSMMDLTLEAQAFGSEVRISDNEVPATIGSIVQSVEDAQKLVVPEVGAGRTQIYIDAMNKACEMITDRPVFAGIIGPFTLAGRLIGISESMIAVKKQKEMVRITLEKATEFIIKYAKAYKEQTGANGFVMAEPLAGVLSPKMNEEFSEPYCKQIIDAVQDEEFIVIYHNCGDNVVQQAPAIKRLGAEGYHFGNIIKMENILPLMSDNALIMGNIDPSGYFCVGSPESMNFKVKEVMEKCCYYPNFVPSSGCDIAPVANWDCIDEFFKSIDEFYTNKGIPCVDVPCL